MGEPRNRAESILDAALQLGTAEERAAYVKAACGADEALRQQVEQLLDASACATTFLEDPAASPFDDSGTGPVECGTGKSEKPGDQVGRYRLLEQIGEGGMGVVWMAQQEEPVRRRVALKIIKLGMDTKEVIARFEAERQALALMDHPNIAKVFDGGATGSGESAIRNPQSAIPRGRPYFVMELVRGIRITDYCEQHRLSTTERLQLFTQVCHAVQHAHQKGIIHRDLKPSNVLVMVNDGGPVPKVIDFGIAKATGQQLTDKTVFTRFAQFLGTPAYMSPEQAGMTNLDIDTRSDIYSLGVILYELLTGRTPFDSKELLEAGLDEMRRVLREKEPPKPSTRLTRELESIGAAGGQVGRWESEKVRMDAKPALQSHSLTFPPAHFRAGSPRDRQELQRRIRLLRGDLDWIVMKALDKDRDRRYETANGLAADLKRHLGNEPVLARPPGALYRLQKFTRRHKVLFPAAAVVFLVAALGLAGVLWQWNRADAKARESQERLARLNVANGIRLQEEGDPAGALLWFVEALKEEKGKPEREDIHQLRLTLNVMKCPKPVYLQRLEGAESAEFSPDGRRLLTVLTNAVGGGTNAIITRTLRLRDVATGQSKDLHQFTAGSLRFARFDADGRFVISAVEMSTPNLVTELRIHEPGTEKASSRVTWITRRLFDRDVYANADGRRVFIAGTGAIQVWDLATGEVLNAGSSTGSESRRSGFSPDGSRFLRFNKDRTVQVIETATGQPLTQPLPHPGMFDPRSAWARFDRSGQRVFTIIHNSPMLDADSELRLWDVATGRPRLAPLRQTAFVHAADFSPDGRLLIAGDRTYREGPRIWDTTTGQIVTRLPAGTRAQDVLFSPDGRAVLTGETAPVLRLWNPASGLPITSPLWQRGTWSRFRFTPDGRYILNASPEEARVWDLRPEQLPGWQQRHEEGGRFMFSPDGKLLSARVAGDATIKVWDVRNGAIAWPEFKARDATISSMAFTSDGLRVVVASQKPGSGVITNQVWDAQTARPVGASFVTKGGSIELGLEGHRALVGESLDTGEVMYRLIDLSTGLPMTRIPTNYCGTGRLSPDGRFVLLSEETTPANFAKTAARVFDVRTGEPISRPLLHVGRIYHAVFSPNGRRVVTRTFEGIARIWDATSGRALTPSMSHGGFFISVVFSPDSRKLVTVGDHSARVLHATTAQLLTKPMVHENPVMDASFSPDGRLLLTRTRGGVYVWDTASGERIAVLLPEGAVATFGPAGRQVALRLRTHICMLNLPEIKLTPEEWLAVGRLLSGREPDGQGGLAALQERSDSFLRLAPELLQPLLSKLGFSRWTQTSSVRPTYEPPHGIGGDSYPPAPAALGRWHLEQAEEAEKAQASFGASFHLDRLAAMHTNDSEVRLRWAMAMIRRGAWSEVAAKQPALAELVPPRDPKTPIELLDLSAHYNAPLGVSWLATLPEWETKATLASLPRGVREVGGTRFDVRGIVQTGSWSWGSYNYSRRTEGIPVRQTCRALSFLHASIHGTLDERSGEPVADGTEIGCYIVHYSDGRLRQRPIIYGRHLRSWAVPSPAPEKATEAELAWTAETEGTRIRLYKDRWPNPLPEVRIESVDLVLWNDAAAPFLIAITAEPLPSSGP